MTFAFFAAAVAKVAEHDAGQFDWTTLITSALVAAVISAVVAILGQRVSRQNAELAAKIAQKNAELAANLEVAKTLAKSRQEWINILREDMAQFVGLSAKRSRCLISNEEFSGEEFARMVALSARIQMRLNPKDEDFDELLGAMSDCSLKKAPAILGKATKSFTRISQRLLKREWEALKKELVNLNAEAELDT